MPAYHTQDFEGKGMPCAACLSGVAAVFGRFSNHCLCSGPRVVCTGEFFWDEPSWHSSQTGDCLHQYAIHATQNRLEKNRVISRNPSSRRSAQTSSSEAGGVAPAKIFANLESASDSLVPAISQRWRHAARRSG